MFYRAKLFFIGSLRRQLTFGMALVVALVMFVFVWDFNQQQQAEMIKQQSEEARTLARIVSSASSVWVASRDFSGIQEIINGLRGHPDLRYAIVLDDRGQILAHSDLSRRGQYMTDLPQRVEQTIRQQETGFIDVIDPIMLAGNQVGWVWIGLGRDSLDVQLARIKIGGILFALVAIALSTLIAVLSGRYLTRRLYEIQKVANAVEKGNFTSRVPITLDDEAAKLSRHFNGMLDMLEHREAALSDALQHLQMITNRVPGVIVFQCYRYRDGRFCIPYVSEAIREIYHVSPDAVRDDASSILAVVHPDDLPKFLASNKTSALNMTPWLHEYRLKFEGEPDTWLLVNAMPQREADGSVLWYGFINNITERKRLEAQVREMAFNDALTKLPNRRLLKDRLNQAIAVSKRSGFYGVLMFLDLDNFKSLNDSHGHEAGDLLLKQVADRLRSCVREMDTVVRFGGDEFVVLVSELNVDKSESIIKAGSIAEKIRDAMAWPYVLKIQNEGIADKTVEHSCTASIGVALFVRDETSPDNVLKYADAAMYQAKEAGGNLIRFYDSENRMAA